tara:strand:+ start:630 stop:1049 length:420 start_codon:yes stop_codon:yes gene_type:complete
VIKKRNLSQEDKKTWADYIRNPSDIYDKDKNKILFPHGKNRYKFDLHGFSLDDANKKIKDIILFCVEKQYKEILLITGKGSHSKNEKNIYTSKELSKLKYSVPEFINSNIELKKLIHSINTAELKDGGDGAIVIKLKNL